MFNLDKTLIKNQILNLKEGKCYTVYHCENFDFDVTFYNNEYILQRTHFQDVGEFMRSRGYENKIFNQCFSSISVDSIVNKVNEWLINGEDYYKEKRFLNG